MLDPICKLYNAYFSFSLSDWMSHTCPLKCKCVLSWFKPTWRYRYWAEPSTELAHGSYVFKGLCCISDPPSSNIHPLSPLMKWLLWSTRWGNGGTSLPDSQKLRRVCLANESCSNKTHFLPVPQPLHSHQSLTPFMNGILRLKATSLASEDREE